MAIMNTGFYCFQANASKLRRPVDSWDVEELPDARDWFSCERQADVWGMFSDNSCLSAILDRQRLVVAAPTDLRTKKIENFTLARLFVGREK